MRLPRFSVEPARNFRNVRGEMFVVVAIEVGNEFRWSSPCEAPGVGPTLFELPL